MISRFLLKVSQLVDKHIRYRIECRASGRTLAHDTISKCCDFKVNNTDLPMIPLCVLTCQQPV